MGILFQRLIKRFVVQEVFQCAAMVAAAGYPDLQLLGGASFMSQLMT